MAVECMDELSPFGRALFRAVFAIAYLGICKVSKYLISDDRLKLFYLANASLLSGVLQFVL